MCGRFTQTKSRREQLDTLANIELPPLFSGLYNIAPTQQAIGMRTPNRAIVESMQWGFRTPQGTSPVINARIETLHEKTLFSYLLPNNRCIIFADGFYEWAAKCPWYFTLPSHPLFAFGGLWRPAKDHPNHAEFVIITQPANSSIKRIHHRMPLILQSNEWSNWLSDGQIPECTPMLESHPVSPRMNRVSYCKPDCIQPIGRQTDLDLFPDNE